MEAGAVGQPGAAARRPVESGPRPVAESAMLWLTEEMTVLGNRRKRQTALTVSDKPGENNQRLLS